MFESPRFKKYFLPGFVFQSMVIGGGYGTGRELVEFFLQYGPLGGLLGMLFVSTVIWCAVCAVTFELARITGSYDYRTFTRQLLGRGWVLYEVCYIVMMLLGLAVIAAAGGSIVQETFKLPYYAGVIGMMAGVGFLVFQGTPVIEKFFSMWSFVLYAVYFVFFVWSLFQLGAGGVSGLVTEEIKPGWFLAGIKYAAYNLVLIPALLFCVRHVQTRKEAISAGLLAGPIEIIPGFFFYLAMVSQHPGILEHTVPVNHVLEVLGSKIFQFIFQIVLLGTLIESGSGGIHAFNERIAGAYLERKFQMPPYLRPLVAVLLLAVASGFARFGLINLISQGYGTATWGVLLVYVVPVLTLGVRKIIRTKEAPLRESGEA